MFVTAFYCCISGLLNGSMITDGVVPWLRELAVGHLPPTLEFDARPFYVESVVQDAALGQVFLQAL